MRRLQSRKFCAALVIIAWLATLVSLWGMTDAGRRAVTPEPSKPRSCKPRDLQGMGLQLEMASSAATARDLLTGHGITDTRAACIRKGVAAQVWADYLLIPAYSCLTLALFLFVRTVRIRSQQTQKALGWGLLVPGLVLAAAMFVGDVFENLQLTPLIDLAESNRTLSNARFDLLRKAGYLKWSALATSSLLLALLWDSRSFPRLLWLLRLLGVTAAALFIAGLVKTDWQIVNAGMGVLGALWLAALIHAVAVAVETEPIQVAQTHPEA